MKSKRQARDKTILETFARCGTVKRTAMELGHSVNTVRKVLRGESAQSVPPKTVGKRPSKLDAYRPIIRRLVLEDGLTGVLVFEELKELGYEGGYSILKTFIREIRPRKRRPTMRLEHRPGEEAQFDWSPYMVWIGDEQVRVKAFSMVLPFSSWMFLRFALDETLDTLIALHEEAFSELGAIPALCSYDNMTTVGRHIGPGDVKLNARFAAFAKHYGFAIKLIEPGRPNQHASVERHFSYVENNCLKRRRSRFDDLTDLNRHATWWCHEVANLRVHGTTRQRPSDLLERERVYMLPLPHQRPTIYRSLERVVGQDFCVQVDNKHYSVHPQHIGRQAEVRLFPEHLEVFISGRPVGSHPLLTERGERSILPEHEEAFKRCFPSRLVLEQAFLRLGDAANRYYEGLKTSRGRGAGYHIQRILKLADRYGADSVCGALSHAAQYGNYSADAVSRVLTGHQLKDLRSDSPHSTMPNPERARQWLRGMDVEEPELSDFDRLVNRFTSTQTKDDKDDR